MSFSLSEYSKIDVGWSFVPGPTGELTALPRPPSWFQGGRFAAGGEYRGWREGLRKREEGKGKKGGNGEGKEKGEVGE